MESKDVIDVHAVFLSFADGSGAIVYARHDTIWANVGGELTIEDDIPYLRAFGFNGDEKTYKLTNIQAGLDIIKCLRTVTIEECKLLENGKYHKDSSYEAINRGFVETLKM